MAGIEVPGGASERGTRIWCPWGEFSHPDGGAEAAFRVYYDHGFCFAEGAYFSPAGICAAVWDCTITEAARQMLELAGISSPDYREHWRSVVDWSQPPDLDALAATLRLWCAERYPQWRARQYDKPVAGKLAACLGLLGKVRTEADCRMWLSGCKRVMKSVLDEGE